MSSARVGSGGQHADAGETSHGALGAAPEPVDDQRGDTDDAPLPTFGVSRTDAPAPLTLNRVVPADPWRDVREALVVAYVIGYVVWFATKGLIIDRISVLISLAVLLVLANVGRPLYRWGQLGRDLVLYSLMWLAYEESRGIADRIGMPLQVRSVINADRVLFLGNDPTVWLQRRFYSAATVRWYDVVASVTYYTHFVVPVAVIAMLWIAKRREWVRFIRRFATTLFIGCLGFVLLPTAPPWMAAGGDREHQFQELPPLARPAGRGWYHLGLEGFVHAWETGRDWVNRIAAMPSLHGAFSLMVVVFFFPWIKHWWLRVALLCYPLVMAVSLVYLAEHYVIDVVAGWAVVGLSFLVWNHIERRLRDRRAGVALPAARPDLDPTDPVAVP